MSNKQLVITSLVATLALVGCTKEITPPSFENDKVAPATEGTRVIAVSFAAQSQTKTTLEKDGLTPNFVKGDKILVANGQDEPDTCIVSVNGGKATISTNLTGPLNAVYPAKAAKMNDSNPKQIDTVLVSAVQSGKFADANICMAKDITNEAVFENKTAVLRFYVDESIGVTSVKVTSQSEEITPNKGMEITVQTDGCTLFGLKGNIDQRICYVAIPSGQYTKLTLSSTANTQTPEPRELDNVTLNIGTMYNAFIPYYIQVGDQKWAYCNIGAFLPEEPGLYFAWGDTKGYKWDAQNNQFENGHWFDWKNCPFNNNMTYCVPIASVLAEICTNIEGMHYVLNPGYDAAYQKWGEKWRMPTSGDAKELFESTNTTGDDITGNVLTIHGSSLKIPVSGSSNSDNPTGDDGTVLTDKENGYLWTSSMVYNSSVDYYNPNYAMAVSFVTYNVSTTGKERKFGLPIRPIYDPAPEVVPEGALSGKFTINADGDRVYFSKGNLYCTRTDDGADGYTYSFAFETNQYDYRTINDGTIVGKCVIGGEEKDTTPENTSGLFQWNLDDVGEGKGYGAFTNGEVSKTTPATLDWGEAYNAQHAGENWTTLKISEWNYLTKTRKVNGDTDFGKTCQWVKYNGEWGLIIYCDGYDKTQYKTYATIPTDEFPEGCAFLPESNRRYGTNIYPNVRYYWLGEVNSADFGSYAYFNETQVGVTDGVARATGLSVRLVTPVSSAGK